jgi:tRNA-dihydrouridine synthase
VFAASCDVGERYSRAVYALGRRLGAEGHTLVYGACGGGLMGDIADGFHDAGAKIIGVNNRNLKDFSVDFDNAARLRDRIPAGCVYVAESGVKTPEDVDRLRRIGADAALIGEALMRSEDPAAMLRRLKGEKE